MTYTVETTSTFYLTTMYMTYIHTITKPHNTTFVTLVLNPLATFISKFSSKIF